jgi:hypothetical protein
VALSVQVAAQLVRGNQTVGKVLHKINGRHNEGNRTPPAEHKIHLSKLPKVFVNARLAHVSLNFMGLATKKHADIPIKGNVLGFAHVSAEWTLPRVNSAFVQRVGIPMKSISIPL